MRGAVYEGVEPRAALLHTFGRVCRGPVVCLLLRERCPHHGNCLVKVLEHDLPGLAAGIIELERPVAHITRVSDFRSYVVVQVTGEMQQQMTNAVAVRIRTRPQ